MWNGWRKPTNLSATVLESPSQYSKIPFRLHQYVFLKKPIKKCNGLEHQLNGKVDLNLTSPFQVNIKVGLLGFYSL